MNAVIENSEVSMLSGERGDVLKALKKSQAEKLLVVQVDHFQPKEFEHFADNIGQLAMSLREYFTEEFSQKKMQELVENFAPSQVAKPHLLREAVMESRARKAVLNSGDWLTAAQVAELAGFSPRNPSAQPNKWKSQGQIFAISHKGTDYYPGFALNPDTDYRPYKMMAKIIAVFSGAKHGWGMAYWFQSANSFLGGQKPQDLLARKPERVLDAAYDALEEVAHG